MIALEQVDGIEEDPSKCDHLTLEAAENLLDKLRGTWVSCCREAKVSRGVRFQHVELPGRLKDPKEGRQTHGT